MATALLVGSSGLLGPIWKATLEKNFSSVLTADKYDSGANFRLDLEIESDIDKIARLVTYLDALVLNAGLDSKLEEGGSDSNLYNQEVWRRYFQVNVVGPLALVGKLLSKFNPGTRVVAIGSMYGLIAPRLDVYNSDSSTLNFIKHPAYGASKAALLQAFKQLAVIHAGHHLFNVLTLGVVENKQAAHFRQAMPKNIPTGEFLRAESLGYHLEYLLSQNFSPLIGHNLVVDGGYSLW